ncbi:MAG: OsmC family protein [Planctomycetaceae bacterium]
MSKLTNEIDVNAATGFAEAVINSPTRGIARFTTTSRWREQTRVDAEVTSYSLGGEEIPRSFTIASDEPNELLGKNSAPNPQELLMAAMNACMIVGYVANAAARGIQLEKLEIETTGELDLRGFLGLSEDVKPGYESLKYTIRVQGDATESQFKELHEHIQKTSPNYFNISHPIRLNGELVVE